MVDVPRKFKASDNPAIAKRLRVWFNAFKEKYCVAYDIDEGWIERYVTDENGKFVTDDDELKIERLYGNVIVLEGIL